MIKPLTQICIEKICDSFRKGELSYQDLDILPEHIIKPIFAYYLNQNKMFIETSDRSLPIELIVQNDEKFSVIKRNLVPKTKYYIHNFQLIKGNECLNLNKSLKDYGYSAGEEINIKLVEKINQPCKKCIELGRRIEVAMDCDEHYPI